MMAAKNNSVAETKIRSERTLNRNSDLVEASQLIRLASTRYNPYPTESISEQSSIIVSKFLAHKLYPKKVTHMPHFQLYGVGQSKDVRELSWMSHGVLHFWFLLNFLFISAFFDTLDVFEFLNIHISNWYKALYSASNSTFQHLDFIRAVRRLRAASPKVYSWRQTAMSS